MSSDLITRRVGPRSRVHPADVVLVSGLAVVVVGTFLPWLRSGDVTRNSYAAGGAVRRLVDTDGLYTVVLRVWPFVSVACAACVALLLVGLGRTATALAVPASGIAAGVAVWALTARTPTIIAVMPTGPTITIIGAAAVWLAVLTRYPPLDRFTGRIR